MEAVFNYNAPLIALLQFILNHWTELKEILEVSSLMESQEETPDEELDEVDFADESSFKRHAHEKMSFRLSQDAPLRISVTRSSFDGSQPRSSVPSFGDEDEFKFIQYDAVTSLAGQSSMFSATGSAPDLVELVAAEAVAADDSGDIPESETVPRPAGRRRSSGDVTDLWQSQMDSDGKPMSPSRLLRRDARRVCMHFCR